MNKINISNAPAYTSPNSMTLICTEKPDGSTNLATLAFWAFASTNWLRRKKLFSPFPELN